MAPAALSAANPPDFRAWLATYERRPARSQQSGGAMPKSRRYPITELRGTLQRSCREAQEAFLSALDDAVRIHGSGDKAHRAAYLARQQRFENRGDHWIAKDTPTDGGGGGSGKSSGQQIPRAES